MSEDQLTPLPESFLKFNTGARGRLLQPMATLRARYELCEDLASHLVATLQPLHDDGVDARQLMQRCHAGLLSPDSGLNPDEAAWVIYRLAELAQWEMPRLPDPAWPEVRL
jgi:hypothetical protein